jgi:hypothetical protein
MAERKVSPGWWSHVANFNCKAVEPVKLCLTLDQNAISENGGMILMNDLKLLNYVESL